GRIREFIDGSRLCTSAPVSVQDPLSFRVAPQVHGAFREVVQFARAAVDGELAAMDDNPLVELGSGRMISNGNFHPMLLALAIDAVRPALTHVAQLSDRRTGHMWDRLVADPELLAPGVLERVSRAGSLLVRYAGAARVAELRTVAGPATLDVPPVDLGVEDHATNAPLAVRRTDDALGLAEDVLTVELLTATASLGWGEELRGQMAERTGAAFDQVVETLSGLGPGASADRIHVAVRDLIAGPLLAPRTTGRSGEG
ncbi:MAG TPA: aromatic amino acid lyase, partial [Vitreimonas sp.]|nr:aromatic amino acid lyase [Vitreimonas sp.]